jgi:NADH oxidase (H2O2-forming)
MPKIYAEGEFIMKHADIAVIGGSAAGVAAAITARRFHPDKSILLIRKEKQIPIPCGIPYIFGTVGDPQKNLIPVDTMMPGNNIETMVDEVAGIDRAAKQLKLQSSEVVAYGKLILATGSLPIVPRLPGTDKKRVYAVRKDVPYLAEMLGEIAGARDICIIGGGFIGVEIAEECRKKCPDAAISIVEMQKHCLQLVYDEELCVLAEEKLKEQNIALMLDETVEAIGGGGSAEFVTLAGGKKIKADAVILGIGSAANTALAKQAGLDIGPTGGIAADRHMQTSDPDIFACGDCAEKVSFFDGKPSGLKLASIATMEARVAGANLYSLRRENIGVIGAYSTVLGNTAFASAGLTEAQAKEKGYAVVVGAAESVNRHPGCMPGSASLKVKLVFQAGSGILLGGQITGALSGGELINAVSACISRKMTADDIAMFQTGTHPALTASPIAYQLVNAAEIAAMKMRAGK